MASLVDEAPVNVPKPRLLFYVSSSADPGRYAIGPALAAAAERAGWSFDCYYDTFRKGRHFGGGPLEDAAPGWPAGSLVAGGRHADQVLRLSVAYELFALGDPQSVLWPALDAAGAILDIMFTAAFDRYPRMKLVIAEAEAGWLPFYLQQFDHSVKRFGSRRPVEPGGGIPGETATEGLSVPIYSKKRMTCSRPTAPIAPMAAPPTAQ